VKSRSTLYKNLNVSRFPLRDPDILISIMERGSDILLSLDLKCKEQGGDVSPCDIPSMEISNMEGDRRATRGEKFKG
jgi:hypothetical protein